MSVVFAAVWSVLLLATWTFRPCGPRRSRRAGSLTRFPDIWIAPRCVRGTTCAAARSGAAGRRRAARHEIEIISDRCTHRGLDGYGTDYAIRGGDHYVGTIEGAPVRIGRAHSNVDHGFVVRAIHRALTSGWRRRGVYTHALGRDRLSPAQVRSTSNRATAPAPARRLLSHLNRRRPATSGMVLALR